MPTQNAVPTKVEAAKEYLGERWVNHPAYKFNPRHSFSREIYAPARELALREIAERSARDREANPAFLRAEAVRDIFSTH